MHLSGLKILPLLAALACDNSLAPRDVAGVYFLQSINSQRLPVVIGPIPEESITVTSGEISLYQDGNALTVERRREVRNNVPNETNYVFEQRFELDGNRIWLGPRTPCPPNANCAEIEGVITDSSLTLEIGQFTYHYRKAEVSTQDS